MKPDRNNKLVKYRTFIHYFLGPLLFLVLSWFIYREIRKQPNLQEVYTAFQKHGALYLPAVLLLMVINWSLEAMKWKMLVQPVQQISFITSLKAVLTGVSFTLIAPNRMGEYLGRVLYMDDGKRLKTISLTIAGSISQLLITLLMGFAGLLLLQEKIESAQLLSALWFRVILFGVAAVLLGLTIFYFRLSWIIKWVDKIPGAGRFTYLVEALEGLDATILLRLLSLSLLRFGVFIVQYYLLFDLFGVELSWWQAFWGVSVSFLVMAVIPSFAIAELAQRGIVMQTILSIYSSNIAGIISATAGIWFINLIVPAITGSLLILGIKKILKKDAERN
jgi:uncharacterized membrane protein YbhN (UPF0104 family)